MKLLSTFKKIFIFLILNFFTQQAISNGIYIERINLSQKEKQNLKERPTLEEKDAKSEKKFKLSDYVQFGALHKHKNPEIKNEK